MFWNCRRPSEQKQTAQVRVELGDFAPQHGALQPISQRELYDEFTSESPEEEFNRNAEILYTTKKKLEQDLFGGKSDEAQLKKTHLMHPKCTFKLLWDFWIAVLLLFVAIQTPWQIAFMFNDDLPQWCINCNLIVDISYLADIIIIFNTAFLYEETLKLETNRKEVACIYMRGMFIIDLIAIMPVQLFSPAMGNSLYKLIRVTKMSRVLRLVRITRMIKILKEGNTILKWF
jgi:hypothetical protein